MACELKTRCIDGTTPMIVTPEQCGFTREYIKRILYDAREEWSIRGSLVRLLNFGLDNNILLQTLYDAIAITLSAFADDRELVGMLSIEVLLENVLWFPGRLHERMTRLTLAFLQYDLQCSCCCSMNELYCKRFYSIVDNRISNAPTLQEIARAKLRSTVKFDFNDWVDHKISFPQKLKDYLRYPIYNVSTPMETLRRLHCPYRKRLKKVCRVSPLMKT